ncbi:MAG: stage II sporulation protein D [Clostridiales bacterium]|nr:stage II sporulation protein D [Clostridiales bacterium]
MLTFSRHFFTKLRNRTRRSHRTALPSPRRFLHRLFYRIRRTLPLSALLLCTALFLPALLVLLFSGSTPLSHDQNGQRLESQLFPNLSPSVATANYAVTIWLTDEQRTCTLNLEDYLVGVVASEMPSSFEPEALKAQAVAARTYSLSRVLRGEASGFSADHPQAALCDTEHCQVYRPAEELAAIKGQSWMTDGYEKIKTAVRETAGLVLLYEGSLVTQPLFFSASGGRTENSEDVFVSAYPYLRSVDSLYEGDSPYRAVDVSVPLAELADLAKTEYGISDVSLKNIRILSYTAGGSVAEMQIGDKVLSGRQIRSLLGLRSGDFTVSIAAGDTLIFTTSGNGHGVGMSQYGANGMALAGYSCSQILQHYYSGTEIGPFTGSL